MFVPCYFFTNSYLLLYANFSFYLRDAHSVLYRVVERATGRKLLAKRLPHARRRQLQRELAHWNQFLHPNIPIVYDALVDYDTGCWIVFEK